MYAFVLAVASAAETQAAAASGGPTDLLVRFGVEWKFVIWQFVSFAVLAGVLYQFAIKPILGAVDERNARLAEGLKNAEATAAQLEQAKLDSAAMVKQAQLEGARLIDETRKTAREYLELQQKETAARINDMIAKAQQANESEHKKLLEQARHEVARLVVLTAQQVLAKELTADERARYNEAASRQVNVI